MEISREMEMQEIQERIKEQMRKEYEEKIK